MEYHQITIERKGSLATVTLNRPEVLNTMSLQMLRELRHAAFEFRDSEGLRVIILTGRGSTFTAGLDLKDPEVGTMLSGKLEQRRERVSLGADTCRAWEEIRAVTIAAIEGPCIGGGLSLAISCDFRIMGESAFMRVPEIGLGMNYSWGSLPRLIHLIGPAKTKEMVMMGDPVPAERCLAWGLTEKAVQDGGSWNAAKAMAEKLAQKPAMPVVMTKEAVNRISTALDSIGTYMDADQFLLTTFSDDHQEGVKAFLEKRWARFGGK